eukprot:CAMPEP_0196815142 /NCGR_PEP_ID=MMETSP1362-20130617/48010_1 /TAXON_ID=163516 /ORGANISM="Leptocylindrus danicus, Strain CCMP1856" /LENGTH=509 /DNA_ID=CAMNT_0042191999 /DNA_START=77 /DNA_END=1602 /DNA_ORIENTATION=-
MAQDEYFGNSPSMWYWGWRWGGFRYGFFDDDEYDDDSSDGDSSDGNNHDGVDEDCEGAPGGGGALAILLQPGSPSTSTGEGKDWDAILQELRNQGSQTVINVRGFCHAGRHGAKTYLLHELCAYNAPNDILRMAIDINQKALASGVTQTNYLESKDANGLRVLHRACSNGNSGGNIRTVLEAYPQAAACQREFIGDELNGRSSRNTAPTLPIYLYMKSNISEVRGDVVDWLLDAYPAAAMLDVSNVGAGVGERCASFSSSLIRVSLDRIASVSSHYMSIVSALLSVQNESSASILNDPRLLEDTENQMEECWKVLDSVLLHAIKTHKHEHAGVDGVLLSSDCLLHYFLNLYYDWTDCHIRYDASLEIPRVFIRRHVDKIMVRDGNGNLPLHSLLKMKSARKMFCCRCASNNLHLQHIQYSMETLLSSEAGSKAARTSNNQLELPMHLALENGVCWGDTLKLMVNAAPESLRTRDIHSRLYPFMVAAAATAECNESCHCVTTLDTIFNLL